MGRRVYTISFFIICALALNIKIGKTQLQTFAASSKTAISGEKVKLNAPAYKQRGLDRNIVNNKKKKKIKTQRKTVYGQSSRFTIFYSKKSAKRQKAINRQRRRSS